MLRTAWSSCFTSSSLPPGWSKRLRSRVANSAQSTSRSLVTRQDVGYGRLTVLLGHWDLLISVDQYSRHFESGVVETCGVKGRDQITTSKAMNKIIKKTPAEHAIYTHSRVVRKHYPDPRSYRSWPDRQRQLFPALTNEIESFDILFALNYTDCMVVCSRSKHVMHATSTSCGNRQLLQGRVGYRT